MKKSVLLSLGIAVSTVVITAIVSSGEWLCRKDDPSFACVYRNQQWMKQAGSRPVFHLKTKEGNVPYSRDPFGFLIKGIGFRKEYVNSEELFESLA